MIVNMILKFVDIIYSMIVVYRAPNQSYFIYIRVYLFIILLDFFMLLLIIIIILYIMISNNWRIINIFSMLILLVWLGILLIIMHALNFWFEIWNYNYYNKIIIILKYIIFSKKKFLHFINSKLAKNISINKFLI
jgi:hypothetical protein